MDEQLYQKAADAAEFIRAAFGSDAGYAVLLGTGTGDFTTTLEAVQRLPYEDIPHFPKGNVESHKGELIKGSLFGKSIIVLSGRSHYYEGFSAADVAFPVYVLSKLGVKHLIITNAAGGVSPHFREGDLVMIEDHINFLPDNPLRGKNDERLGLRFPDMMYAYCPSSMEIFTHCARKQGIPLQKGVYLAMQGPSLETPAEYNMAYRMGADLVGMSTVPEVIAARHAGLSVSAFSIVSNVCYPRQILTPTTLESVIDTVRKSSEKLNRLLLEYFSQIP